ncbi:MAG: hypothetical protein Q4G04_06785 [bacterium]|nr:hypothetical protein [bacterium]
MKYYEESGIAKKDFITNFWVSNKKYIIVKYADGREMMIRYSEDTINKLIDEMTKQLKHNFNIKNELDDEYETCYVLLFASCVAGGTSLIILNGVNLLNNGISLPTIVSMPLICACGISGISAIYNSTKLLNTKKKKDDFAKCSYFFKNSSELNDLLKEYGINATLDINNITNLSLSDLKNLSVVLDENCNEFIDKINVEWNMQQGKVHKVIRAIVLGVSALTGYTVDINKMIKKR